MPSYTGQADLLYLLSGTFSRSYSHHDVQGGEYGPLKSKFAGLTQLLKDRGSLTQVRVARCRNYLILELEELHTLSNYKGFLGK